MHFKKTPFKNPRITIPIITCFFSILLLSTTSYAKRFRNSYVSFELPPQWNCSLEKTEWVCVSSVSQRSKEAIIILTAKEVGPSDSLPSYESYLKIPKSLTQKNGLTTPSKVLHVRQSVINHQPWVDGMHMGSEVLNYYTRYLATIKGKIAILVTFSAHKQHYTKYSSDFLNAIQSLDVVASNSLLASGSGPGIRGSNETLGAPIGAAIPSDMMGDELINDNNSSGNTKFDLTSIIAGGILILAALGYVILKRKRG